MIIGLKRNNIIYRKYPESCFNNLPVEDCNQILSCNVYLCIQSVVLLKSS
jgi:hypothetical protein